MTELVIELPDTLSGLLRVAVNDAKLCEADPRFRLNMSNWVEASDEEDASGNPLQCHVCMAGAVLVQRSGLPLDQLYGYEPVDERDGEDDVPSCLDIKLRVINHLRNGAMNRACVELMGWDSWERILDLPEKVQEAIRAAGHEIDETYRGSRASWDSYEAAADILEGVGL